MVWHLGAERWLFWCFETLFFLLITLYFPVVLLGELDDMTGGAITADAVRTFWNYAGFTFAVISALLY